jgi:hypothetical protein
MLMQQSPSTPSSSRCLLMQATGQHQTPLQVSKSLCCHPYELATVKAGRKLNLDKACFGLRFLGSVHFAMVVHSFLSSSLNSIGPSVLTQISRVCAIVDQFITH